MKTSRLGLHRFASLSWNKIKKGPPVLNQLKNPFRGTGLPGLTQMPISDPSDATALIARCPNYARTPLRNMAGLAADLGLAELWVKDESGRMGLGSFKALGAVHAIARDAAASADGRDLSLALKDRVYVTASAGNHGLSVAAGASVFGARAVIFLAETVPDAFAARLRAKGAEVVRAGAHYEASMVAAADMAAEMGWTLLSDSTWPGAMDPGTRVMEGYLIMAQEIVAQITAPPTHVLLQAGVGGLAAGVAAHLRAAWGDAPQIIVAEPNAAPAVMESIRAGQLVTAQGPVSNMGRLDCKTPSLVALAGLARDADMCVTLSDAEATAGIAHVAEHGLATTPSGGAGLAALCAGLDLGPDARVLTVLSEGPEDG
ncbi:pyridoxal-phosphate dependent enzyme [Epibacterium ulvae]|nr:pyridoxal-phosphate dependent enzyme [Epibacterium ulvae]